VICKWCDAPIAELNDGLQLCTSCAPYGNTVHECPKPGHGGTFSARACNACQDEDRRRAKLKIQLQAELIEARKWFELFSVPVAGISGVAFVGAILADGYARDIIRLEKELEGL